MPSLDRIDTHIHIVLDCYVQAIKDAGGDPSGWKNPSWSPAAAIAAMDALDIKTAVWSVTSPGPCIAGHGKAGRDLARQMNDETAALVKEQPERFAFFASLPSFVDVEGAIAEAEHAINVLHATGVVVMTTYADKLLGDPSFQRVWDKLDELKAIVFIHPASVDIKPGRIAGKLPQPTIDYPHQASHFPSQTTFSNHPNVKIILSHAGGTLPYLADRVIKSLDIPQVADAMQITSADCDRDFKRFYLDVAVSTSRPHLYGLLSFTSPEKILFGTDWPYAPFSFGKATTEQFDEFQKTDAMGHLLKGVNRENAIKLFGWGKDGPVARK
ncbi:hypothetical protein RQP46_010936 [Phenoliferia psychrophenolica]